MELLFLAGHRAYERIRPGGLSADDVKMVVGASGAAKWLVLHGLEAALFGQWFAAWEKTVEMSSRLGEQFLEVVETGQVRELVQRIG